MAEQTAHIVKSAALPTGEPMSTPTVPAGWYPDPEGGAQLRYWDGGQWTAGIAPTPPAVPPAAAALPAKRGGFPGIALVAFFFGIMTFYAGFGPYDLPMFAAIIFGAIGILLGLLGRQIARDTLRGKVLAASALVLCFLGVILSMVLPFAR